MEELVKCVQIVAVYLGNSCVGSSLHVELSGGGGGREEDACMCIYVLIVYTCV